MADVALGRCQNVVGRFAYRNDAVVTAVARCGRPAKDATHMTLFTGNALMGPGERKAGGEMVEAWTKLGRLGKGHAAPHP